MKKTATLLYLLLAIFCSAQGPAYRHYAVEQGLPSTELYDLLQDHNGFIWLASDRGVSRYDGYSFRNFNSSDGLTDNTVFLLQEDSAGHVWCGTFNNHLCYFNGDQIIPYAHNDILEKQAHSNRVIQSFCPSSSGDLFIGYQRNGCMQLSSGGKTERFQNTDDGIRIHHEVYVRQNYFIFGSNDNISKDPEMPVISLHIDLDGKVISLKLPGTNPSFYIAGLRKKNGTVLVGVQRTLIEIDRNGNYRVFPFQSDIIRLNEDAAGNTWISCGNNGVRKYAAGADFSSTDFISFLPGETVTDVLQDHEGGYWFATLGHGLFYLASSDVHCISSGGEAVTALAAADDGKIFLGTSNGLMQICSQGKIVATINCNGGKDSADFIQDICVLPGRKTEWICTNKSILLANEKEVTLRTFRSGFGRTVAYDPDSGIWIGGTGRIMHFTKDNPEQAEKNYEFNWRIEVLFFDTVSGDLLAGKQDGLFRLNDTLLEYCPLPGGSIKARVSAIKRTKNGKLVIGTIGDGIVVIDGKKQVQIGNSAGLGSQIVNDLDCDVYGNIWAATNAGIAKIHFTADTFSVESFSIFHGLPTNEVRKILCRNDTIWLGTSTGAAWFIPDLFRQQPVPPPVFIRELRVNGNEKDFSVPQSLDWNQNQLRFSFLGLAFRNGGKTTYRYRLSGLENEWTYTNNISVEYASLPPGDYTFEVMARNGDGTWSSKPARFDFVIHPPFWKRWWFWLLLLVFAGTIAGIFIRARLRIIRKDALQREQMAEYQHRALAAQMNPHFVFNSLSSMQAFVLNDEKENALRYIDRFSFLMRKSLEHSMLKFVPLEQEMDLLRAYLDIESMRFGEKLNYTIRCIPPLVPEMREVPAMLVQPFVENAIRHGLLHRDEPGGSVQIEFSLDEDALWCRVEDNGTGRENSARINRSRMRPASFGSSITEERLRLLCSVTGQPFSITYTDKKDETGNSTGTVVYFTLPSRKRND